MELTELKGVIPAIVTPFDEHDAVDHGALERLTTYLVDSGVHAIMATGGTGEFPNLDEDERKGVIRTIARATAGKVPVIAGTASNSLRTTLRLAEHAAEVGAQSIISVPPYYFPLPERALASYFTELASGSPLPLFVYNNPLYTGNPMGPSLLVDLLEHPNVVGLKQSASDLGQLVEVISEVRVRRGLSKSICTGIDSQFVAALASGADGVFSTAAGIVPSKIVELYRSAAIGDYTDARRRQLELQPLNRFLEYDPGYVAPAKEGLGMIGFPVGAPRAPMPGLTPEDRTRLSAALEALGVLKGSES